MDEKDHELNVLRRQVAELKRENLELKGRLSAYECSIETLEKALNRPYDARNGDNR